MEIEELKNKIEKYNTNRQQEILHIFLKYEETYTENHNGTFINLSLCKKNTINELNKYIDYIEKQDVELDKLETIKEEYKKTYFKDNKDKDNKEQMIHCLDE
jgi:polysaccharide deacetylase 2 family uncharacterized protein YibQ|tara:strand:+ start:7246 stop:7551 length:306 start_codon:yes stop_codon:yes gene_type:complete